MIKLSVDQSLLQAKNYAKKGQILEAEKLYKKILEAFPKNNRARDGLAALVTVSAPQDLQLLQYFQVGKYNEAENLAISFTQEFPNYQFGWKILGVLLGLSGRNFEAINANLKAIALLPQDAEVHNNLGSAFKEVNKLVEAEASYRQAIFLKPELTDAHYNLGVTLEELGKLDEAEVQYCQAISLKPDYAEAHCNLGSMLKEVGRLEEAEASCRQAIVLKPDFAEAYNNLGSTLKEGGKLKEAEVSFTHAIKLKPNFAVAYNNIGNILQDQGKLEEAIDACNQSISLKPDYAEAHKNLSFALLNFGKLKEGLDEYEWRWKTKKFLSRQRHFSKPLWDGKKSLSGKKILLWCEQGIGDTITWSSCIPLVKSMAEHCILECQEKLVPLLKHSFPNVEVKPENRNLDKERDDFDFHLPMGSLYKHFIDKIIKNSKCDAYLVPDPLRVKFWRERLNSLGKGPYIGISWKSSNISPTRLPNYAQISDWSPVLTLPDITFINLQYKDYKDDLIKIRNQLGVTEHHFDD